MDTMKAIMKMPNHNYYEVVIPNDLKALQKLVDGYIEVVPYPYHKNTVIICNEEGLINDMTYKCQLGEHYLFGTILICGVDGEEFCDVDPEVAPDLQKRFPVWW